MSGADPVLQEGWIDRELALEFPALRIVSVLARNPSPPARTPTVLRERLALLADRFRGARAVTLRREPVPAAYRAFFRHVGLDPDLTRVPAEAAAIERLVQGGFVSRNLLDDALTIALVETGVPLWALDAAPLDGPLGVRLAADGERLGGDAKAGALPAGQIVVADAAVPLAPLFGEPPAAYAVTRRTKTLRLFAVQVDGVPALHVAEALWRCAETLRPS